MDTMEARFARWFRGDEAAVLFARQLWTAAQEWDDLEDEGRRNHEVLLAWLAFGKEPGIQILHCRILV